MSADWKYIYAQSLKPAFNPEKVGQDYDAIMDELDNELKKVNKSVVRLEDGDIQLPTCTFTASFTEDKVEISVLNPSEEDDAEVDLVMIDQVTVALDEQGLYKTSKSDSSYKSFGKEELSELIGGLLGIKQK